MLGDCETYKNAKSASLHKQMKGSAQKDIPSQKAKDIANRSMSYDYFVLTLLQILTTNKQT